MRIISSLLLGFTISVTAESLPEKKPAEDSPKTNPVIEKIVEPVSRDASVTIAGQKIPYRVKAGKTKLLKDDGTPRASIFHVSYERTDVKDASQRPVMFAFNGGPGSSSVWLHVGVLGPKILKLPGDGTTAPVPPVRVIDNGQSILDVCDLVFIDPVSTGYSRAEKDTKPADFHGLEDDIESVGDFIRRWIAENNRWGSPKFLLGESYGGVRAAGLSSHLQQRYGMSLNGVVLLSSLLDFSTLQAAQGNDLAFMVFLPAFTGTAHFHGKIEGNRDALVKEATDFAFGDYAAALIKGEALDMATRKNIATKLERFSGIATEKWLERDLRISASFFRAELLRIEGKFLGRFDSRVAWDATDKAAAASEYDPSYSLAFGAFSTALNDYLGRELGYKEDQPYEILTNKVQPWRWDASNQVVNLSDRLATAMRDNPHLKVLIMGGHTDLATPPEGVAYSVRHMIELPDSVRGNFSATYYEGGHMFYLNPPDLDKTRKDLVEFIKGANP